MELKNNIPDMLDANSQSKSTVHTIAEAGVNHNGSVQIAKKLIKAAKNAHANFIKFQLFQTNKLVHIQSPLAEYQIDNSESANQFELLSHLELSFTDMELIKRYADSMNIIFFATPFDKDSVDVLDELDVPLFKTSSADITNIPLIKYIAQKGKPILISTGMATLKEIQDVIRVIEPINSQIVLLHCVSSYPTPLNEMNLLSIKYLKENFNFPVGFSDHSIGTEAAVIAVVLGAGLIEKHLTLDNSLPGPDHLSSANPRTFREMVDAIRRTKKALGSYGIKLSPSEKKNIEVARRSLFLNKEISQGTTIKEEDIIALRPGSGISPSRIYEVIGKKAIRNLLKGDLLSFNDLE